MKKSELKNIIKECVKEVIFEEGVLSGIISEVATGLRGAPVTVVQETKKPLITPESRAMRRQVLDSVAKTTNPYEEAKQKFANPELFEGTKPVPAGDGKGPLSGVAPGDPGIDLTNIPGMSSWAHLAKGKSQ
jgi:hypothetical protein|tara:strand:+ start:234 stop:629 length:396 start_codon:yes stop_codon:yes gene_type:complete